MNTSLLTSLAALVTALPCVAQELSVVEPPKEPLTYRFDLTDTKHYTPAVVSRDGGGLVIAGSNFSSQIARCESINGIAIAKLELLMRPGNKDDHGSVSGFLGKDENLIDVLVADNDFVCRQGFTHRQLAIPLLQISQRAVGMLKTGRSPFEFEHAGTSWKVAFTFSRGKQFSPFNDGTKTQCDFTLTNIDNNETIEFSGLVPLMIERYGFYEGKGTPYRVEPADIIRVLGLKSTAIPTNDGR